MSKVLDGKLNIQLEVSKDLGTLSDSRGWENLESQGPYFCCHCWNVIGKYRGSIKRGNQLHKKTRMNHERDVPIP